MAKKQAKEFLDHLIKNPDLVDMMKGFTEEEFKEAVEEYRGEHPTPNHDIWPKPI